MSIDTLNFPKDIAEEIGLGVREINHLKRLGCRFFGGKLAVLPKRVRMHPQGRRDRRAEAVGLNEHRCQRLQCRVPCANAEIFQ